MNKADQLTPAIKQALDAVLDKHLRKNPIWQGDFFTAIEQEPDDHQRWKLLENWIDQMPHASFGFTTYVSHLAARTTDTEVRELLVQNLHEEHNSPANHFRMICGLKGKVQGIPTNYEHEFPSLLPTSRAHVTTHTKVARDGDFFEGLGMLLLIENLTAEEFRRVRESCANTWAKLGKKPENFFNGGGGEGYFRANEDADAGHGIDMMIAVQSAIKAEGININDPAAIQPYIERITQGVITSTTCRTNFVQGVYNNAYKAKSNEPYQFTLVDAETIIADNGQNRIAFKVTGLLPHGDSKEGGNAERVSIIPVADLTIDGVKRKEIDLLNITSDIAQILSTACLQGKRNSEVDFRLRQAFEELEKQIPKQREH